MSKALYKSYAFRNKDPVIDILRSLIDLEAQGRGVKAGKIMAEVAKASGVSPHTLYNWFSGTTRCPRYCCVAAVANALRVSWRVGATELQKSVLKKGVRDAHHTTVQ